MQERVLDITSFYTRKRNVFKSLGSRSGLYQLMPPLLLKKGSLKVYVDLFSFYIYRQIRVVKKNVSHRILRLELIFVLLKQTFADVVCVSHYDYSPHAFLSVTFHYQPFVRLLFRRRTQMGHTFFAPWEICEEFGSVFFSCKIRGNFSMTRWCKSFMFSAELWYHHRVDA